MRSKAMKRIKGVVAISLLSLAVVAFTAPASYAKPSEFEIISKHLRANYKAKKVSIPFLLVARAAVKVVRPAGVKSFSVTMFQDLQFSMETIHGEMQSAMRNAFGPDWTPVFRVRSREGQQAYMYMKEDGKDIKVAVVTIDKQQAALIRAKFSPDKLAEFINDPKIFGISVGGGLNAQNNVTPPVQTGN
jgi:hypothetical protein